MLNYMREGGFGMWLLLAAALVTCGLAATRTARARPAILVAGCITSLMLGLLGLSLGLAAVSAQYGRFPDPVAAIGQGLGELSHNGTFAAALAALQGIAALVAAHHADRDA
jgi:hypothetical protein